VFNLVEVIPDVGRPAIRQPDGAVESYEMVNEQGLGGCIVLATVIGCRLLAAYLIARVSETH
jgi:hypothetical protein